MAKRATPGVRVEEIATLPPAVAPVATAIPAFVGHVTNDSAPDGTTNIGVARRLASREGLFAGGSSGAAVAAAARLAEDLPPSRVIVTVLPDSGGRYLSTIFDDGAAYERRSRLCPAAAQAPPETAGINIKSPARCRAIL